MVKKNLPLEGLARAARKYAERNGSQIDSIPEIAQSLEGVDFGVSASITGFNKYSCRQKAYPR